MVLLAPREAFSCSAVPGTGCLSNSRRGTSLMAYFGLQIHPGPILS